jgi:hypothetical protein
MPREAFVMPVRFPTFDLSLKKRGRKWRWCVYTTEGTALMQGSEGDRTAAKYQADRALFLLLLSAPYGVRLSAQISALSSFEPRDAPGLSTESGRSRSNLG